MARNEVDLFDPQGHTINSATHPPSAPHRFWKSFWIQVFLFCVEAVWQCVVSMHRLLLQIYQNHAATAFRRYLCQVASRLFRNKLNFLAVVFLSFPPGACRKAYSNMRIRGMWWTLADSDIYLLLNQKHLQMMSRQFFKKCKMSAEVPVSSLNLQWMPRHWRTAMDWT